jgi:predicted nucleic acid-binding protein
MGKGYLIDSNIIIDYSANRIPKKGNALLSKCIDDDGPVISIITKIELLGYHSVTKEVKDLVTVSLIVGLTDEIVNEAIEIRKNHKIKLPDAIIAATAISLDLTLLSRNTSDFNKIEDLNLLDLFKL